jgi:hypothetical protein
MMHERVTCDISENVRLKQFRFMNHSICTDYCIDAHEDLPEYRGTQDVAGVDCKVYRKVDSSAEGWSIREFYAKTAADGSCIPVRDIRNVSNPGTCKRVSAISWA